MNDDDRQLTPCLKMLVSDKSLLVFPIRTAHDRMKFKKLASWQYLQKMALYGSLRYSC